MEHLLVYFSVFGLAISVFPTILLGIAFKRIKKRPFYLLFSIYLFFALSFLVYAISYYYDEALLIFANFFEMVAFFIIYYQYLKKEVFLAAIPLIWFQNLIFVFSLYFLLYNSFAILKHGTRQRYSLIVFLSFFVLIVSVILNIIYMIYAYHIISLFSLIMQDIGVMLFFVPLYLVLLGLAHEKE